MIIHDCQQNTAEWLTLRLGIPTASGASRLLKSDMSESTSLPKYAQELAQELFTGQMANSFGGNESTDHGHKMEPESRAYYAMHHDIQLVEHGFITDDLFRAGASPDAVRVDNNANVEFKNLQPKGHASAVAYFHKHGTIKKYMQQCHFQNYINTDAPYTDLVHYSQSDEIIHCRFDRSAAWDKAFSLAVTRCLTIRDAHLITLQNTTEESAA